MSLSENQTSVLCVQARDNLQVSLPQLALFRVRLKPSPLHRRPLLEWEEHLCSIGPLRLTMLGANHLLLHSHHHPLLHPVHLLLLPPDQVQL